MCSWPLDLAGQEAAGAHTNTPQAYPHLFRRQSAGRQCDEPLPRLGHDRQQLRIGVLPELEEAAIPHRGFRARSIADALNLCRFDN